MEKLIPYLPSIIICAVLLVDGAIYAYKKEIRFKVKRDLFKTFAEVEKDLWIKMGKKESLQEKLQVYKRVNEVSEQREQLFKELINNQY